MIFGYVLLGDKIMKNYKINFIYNDCNDINDILIKVLKRSLKVYLQEFNYTSCSLALKDKGDNA